MALCAALGGAHQSGVLRDNPAFKIHLKEALKKSIHGLFQAYG